MSVDGSLTYKQLFDGLAVCGIDASSVGFGNADYLSKGDISVKTLNHGSTSVPNCEMNFD